MGRAAAEGEVEHANLAIRGRLLPAVIEDAVVLLSEATVRTHVGPIFVELGLRDRAQAVVAAYEHGLVVPGER